MFFSAPLARGERSRRREEQNVTQIILAKSSVIVLGASNVNKKKFSWVSLKTEPGLVSGENI